MFKSLNNENGSALLLVILLMAALTLLGMISTSTTTTELMVAANDKTYQLAFSAAESGVVNVAATPTLYGGANIDQANPLTASVQPAGSQLDFDLNVAYQGVGATAYLLRHTGFSAGKFRAHEYLVDSVGYGPGTAKSTVKARFYRLGF